MRALTLIALVVAVSIPLAACGDDDESDGGSGSGGTTTQDDSRGGVYGAGGGGDDGQEEASGGGKGQTLRVAADAGGALAFDESSLSAEAGNVTISMDNPSSLPHAVAIEGGGVDASGETVTEGGVSKVSAELEPGEYAFYCPVGNHRDAGMEGTLTVN